MELTLAAPTEVATLMNEWLVRRDALRGLENHIKFTVLVKHPSPFSFPSTYVSLKIKHPMDGHIHSHSLNRIQSSDLTRH